MTKEQIDSGVVKESEPAKIIKEKHVPKYRGMIGTTRTVVAEEGVLALY